MASKAKKRELVEQLQQVDPIEFEALVAKVWNLEGYETTVTDSSNDVGVDVIAERPGPVSQTVAIQVKRYSEGTKVGRPEVQQYASLRTQDPDVNTVAIVTTSSFTDGAKAWAYENDLGIFDGDDLADLIFKHDRADLVEGFEDSSSKSSSSPDSITRKTPPEKVPDRTKTKIQGHLPAVTVTIAMLIGGPVIWAGLGMANVGPILFMLGWMGSPIAIFADIRYLRRHEAKFRSSYLYALGSFLLMGLPGIWYLGQRLLRTDLEEAMGAEIGT